MPKVPRDFYTELGAEWLSQRKADGQTTQELKYVMQFLGKEGKVLDLACGYGRFSIPLAENGYLVEGLDITPAFIERAREEANRRGLKISFRIGNMEALPYEDNSFLSVICMWNAFSELASEREQVSTLMEIYRVLSKGGKALVEVRNHRSSGLVEANVIDGHEAMPSYNHTRGSMKRLVKLAGIENYRIFIDDFGGRKRLLLVFNKA